MLDAALGYAEKGWPIFPCRADKTPYTDNGVLDATTNPETIREWWARWPKANIAVNVGEAGLMVLDIDPGADRNALAQKFPLATGLSQSTPRGGEHLFFELAPGEMVAPSVSKIAPHVDVRSFHSYVLLAPSRTNDGVYEWTGESKPAYRSDEIVRLANVARQKSTDRDNWIIAPDLPENVSAAIEWLKTKAQIAIEGRGGDHMAYATAAHLKSFGISKELAFDLIWEHWNPRCIPPWGAEQADHLEQKVTNGYSYNTSPPGNITSAYRIARQAIVFKPVAKELASGREITAGRFRFTDREGMSHIQPPVWLINKFIPERSYAMLYGAPGTFKTFIALDIALTVASGGGFPWEGAWQQVQQGPVLFIAGEARDNIAKRVMAWEKRHWKGVKVEGMILGDPVPLVGEALDPFLDGALAMSPVGYKLVILDTVGRSLQGLNENAQEHASNFTRLVERLQHELNCAVLALHHTGHEGGRARGSSVFGADADMVAKLTRKDKSMSVELEMLKQKDAPEWDSPMRLELEAIELAPETTSLAVTKSGTPAPQKARQIDTRKVNVLLLDQLTLDVLATNKAKAFSTREIARHIAVDERVAGNKGWSSPSVRRHLETLRETPTTRAAKCYDPATDRWRFLGG